MEPHAVIHDAIVDHLVLDVVVRRQLRRVQDGRADHRLRKTKQKTAAGVYVSVIALTCQF